MHFFNTLEPNGNYKNHQVSHYEILPFAHTDYLNSAFCVEFRKNSNHFPTLHYRSNFCNRVGGCLPRGTNWIFEYNPV